MTLNPQLKRVFLPLTVAIAAMVTGAIKANAEEPDTTDATTVLSRPIARQGLKPIQIAATPQASELRTASRLSEIRPTANRAAALGTVELAQASPTTPSTPTTPNNTPPDSSVPGTTPGGTTTPRTTTPTTPSTTTPGTLTPTTPTTPGTTTPGTLSPTTPTTPGTTTPGTLSPTTPDTTTPGTITPTTPNTTPGINQPGTTTPDTTIPVTPTTPDTTTPQNTPGTEGQPLLQQVEPGRATRSGSSYVGIGGNIGIGSNDTGLGNTSFAVLSKIGLTQNFSVRPSVLFGDNVSILVPITYDFNFGESFTSEFGFSVAPFLGVGAGISTGDGADVGLLLTGGLDIPLSRQFTATASVNATVTGETAVGILLGVGYNFAGF